MEDYSLIEQDVLDYIGKNTHADLKKIHPQSLLFKEGIFDSMGFVQLIDFLEEKFDILMDDNDLIEENFESVTAIVNYVLRKRTLKSA